MRITNNLMIHNMLWNMNNNLVSMNDKQTQLSTGKRIHKPSDDPVGITQVIKVKADIAENAQYKDNVRDAESWLEISENSLMDTKDILQRVRELAVQGANDTYTDEETDKIAKEIDQLIEELIVNSNSTIAGRYIFSGFNTDEPLMNKDGTYNLDITSEKLLDFKSIAYEVAVGENLTVGTNYLNVYGAVPKDSVVTDTFKFGDPRYKEATGKAASHSMVQTPVDFSKDMTGDTTTITVGAGPGAITYTIDSSKLDGRLTQEEYVEVIKSAIQTTPAGAGSLGNVADIYFIPSKNPDNDEGEMVIELKDYGAVPISISSTSTDAFMTNPQSSPGKNAIVPVKSSISGTFDRSVDLTAETLEFEIGGITYSVNTANFDGSPISNTDLIKAIEDAVAKDGSGVLLKEIMNVSFTNTTTPEGTLTLTAKNAITETVNYIDSGSGFTTAPTEIDGVTGKVDVKANLKFIVDLSSDLSIGPQPLTIHFGGTVYTVNTATIDGSINPEDFKTLIENATTSGSSPTTLGADYDVDFNVHEGTIGTLSITQKVGKTGKLTLGGTGATTLGVSFPTISMGEDAEDAVVTGTEEITAAMLTDAVKGVGTQSFVVTYNDETKRIDIDMTSINTLGDLTTEINNQLQNAFGVNGDPPPTNNVTFDIFNVGGKDVVRFTGDAKEDGSTTTLKVDVIMSDKSQLIQDIEDFSTALSNKDDAGIQNFLGKIDNHLDNVLTTLADIGAKNNRIEFIENRIDDNNLAMTEILSKVQDIDYAEVTIQFKSLESIYRASLSVGAKVIQPTLVDFIQ